MCVPLCTQPCVLKAYALPQGQPLRHLSPASAHSEPEMCSFCGDHPVRRICNEPGCSRNRLCVGCSDLWHGHPNRRNHKVENVEYSNDKNASYYYCGQAERGISPRGQSVARHQSLMQPNRQTFNRQSPAFYDGETALVRAGNSAVVPASAEGAEWCCPHCTSINCQAGQTRSKAGERLVCKVCGKTSDPNTLDARGQVSAPQLVGQYPVRNQLVLTQEPLSMDTGLQRQQALKPSQAVAGSKAEQPKPLEQRQVNRSYGLQVDGHPNGLMQQNAQQSHMQQPAQNYATEVSAYSADLKNPNNVLPELQSEQEMSPQSSCAEAGPRLDLKEKSEAVLPLRQDTFQKICSLNISETHKELLLRLVQERKFSAFHLTDLVKAVDSCGDLAYDDEYLIAYLSNKCEKCNKSEPRHKQVCMSQCSCQLCLDCFHQFVLQCIGSSQIADPIIFACPGCHLPKPEEFEKFATHINFLNLQLEEIGKICNWAGPGVVEEFDRVSAECCRDMHIKTKKYANSLTPTQPAFEKLNGQGFSCPGCRTPYFSSKSIADSISCCSCELKFCPCCNFERSLLTQSHSDNCFFSLKSISVSVLTFALKESNIPFEKIASRKSHKNAAEKSGTRPTDQNDLCKAIDFKQGITKGGGFLRCMDRVYRRTSLCERHYKEYLVDLINENKINVQNVDVSNTWRLKNYFAKRVHGVKDFLMKWVA